MTEISDAEVAEIQWASSEEGKAAVRAGWEKAKRLGLDKPSGHDLDMADIGAIVYAACLAAGWNAGEDTWFEPYRDMESFTKWLGANGVSTSLPYGSRGIDPARLMAGITTLVNAEDRLAAQR